jgi:SCY1-like protein 1
MLLRWFVLHFHLVYGSAHYLPKPETAAPEASEALGITSPAQATLVNSAAGAAGALAGWAISSLGKTVSQAYFQFSII